MKWLLLTNPRNPGDCFARLGCEYLIRKADPDARFRLLDKHSQAVHEPIAFDRAVVCGMPLFWSHDTEACWRESWWKALCEWISDEPRKLMLAGVGSFTPWPGSTKIGNPAALHSSAKHILSRCHSCYARDPVVSKIVGHNLPVLPCPSVYSLQGIEPRRIGKVCNLMPDGAHYAKYNPPESEAWHKLRARVAEILIQAGFIFAAHNEREFQLAEIFGWERDRIVCDSSDPVHLLELYAGATCYFGNRIHGAIVSRAAGADVTCIGYDSRQEAVRLVGARVMPPSEIDLRWLEDWANDTPQREPLAKDSESLAMFQAFAG